MSIGPDMPPERLPDRSPAPIASDSVPWKEFGHGERFRTRWRSLTQTTMGDDYRVGVSIEELAPGKTTTACHYHMGEEEHVLILEGACTARVGEERFAMKAGDFISFPRGRKLGHHLINETDAVCRYVMIGENNPDDVCVYTDGNKVLVRSLDERYDRSARRDYWDGEPD